MGRSNLFGVGTDYDCKHWLSLDPCGLICISLSVSLHVFAILAAGFTLISHNVLSQILYSVFYIPFTILALSSLFMAATTNPGAIPMGARPIPENLAAERGAIVTERDPNRGGLRRRRGIRRCRKCCDNYKPPRAHHDSVTGRCIVKMDHYCPWVCNAVGIMNHKFFLLFIFYTFLNAIVSLCLIFIRVIKCGFYIEIPVNNNFTTPDTNSDSFETRHHLYPECDNHAFPIICALGIVSILFFFFTCCMMLEQGEVVQTNMSKIARMKTRAGLVNPGEYAPVATEFNEVFGGDHPTMSWHWFLPLPVRFPEWARDNVLGYEWDITFPVAPYQESPDIDTDTVDGDISLGRKSQDEVDIPNTVGGDVIVNSDVETGGSGGSERSTQLNLLEEKGINALQINDDSTLKKRLIGPFT